MTANVGTVDRLARFVLGFVLLVLPFSTNIALFQSGTATAVAVLAGIVLITTAGLRFCPMYRLFGIRTCKL